MESRSNAVKDLVVGAVIGITSMLPGISGATMAVVFGIYERLIRDLADLKTWLKKDIRFIVLLVVGMAVGVVVCAKVLDHALEDYPVPALMFFIGLIVGQIPMLNRDIGKARTGDIGRNCYIAFAAGIIVMLLMIVLDLIGEKGTIVVSHDIGGFVLMIAVGVVVAVSALLPGLSHSTILLVLGLMSAFTGAISYMDVFLLAPLAIGLVAGVLGFSRVIHNALRDHRLTTMVFILGLTVGSVLVIAENVIGDIHSAADIAVGAVCLVIGYLVSLWSMKMDKGAEQN